MNISLRTQLEMERHKRLLEYESLLKLKIKELDDKTIMNFKQYFENKGFLIYSNNNIFKAERNNQKVILKIVYDNITPEEIREYKIVGFCNQNLDYTVNISIPPRKSDIINYILPLPDDVDISTEIKAINNEIVRLDKTPLIYTTLIQDPENHLYKFTRIEELLDKIINNR